MSQSQIREPVADVPAGTLRMHAAVRLAAEGASAEQLKALVAWAERHSPVADALQRTVRLDASVKIA